MTIPAQDNLKARILAHAERIGGAPFVAGDVQDLGSQAAVNQALSRMSRSGELARDGRGTYRLGRRPSASTPAEQPRREVVLAVASRMFAEKGFFGVSVRDIALESGINAATIYHHFPDKVSLYDEVVRIAWDEGARQIGLAGEAVDASPREQFEGWIANIVAFHFANSEAARIRDREMFLGNWEIIRNDDAILRLTRDNAARLEQIIEAMAPPILKDMSARRIGQMVYGLVYGLIKSMPGTQFIHPDDEAPDVEAIKADVIRFITPILGW